MNVKYAVVKESQDPMQFSSWHETLESARKEAERLCQKDKATFIVIRTVGEASFKSVQWNEHHSIPTNSTGSKIWYGDSGPGVKNTPTEPNYRDWPVTCEF